jgi:hypothetical protein
MSPQMRELLATAGIFVSAIALAIAVPYALVRLWIWYNETPQDRARRLLNQERAKQERINGGAHSR